MSRGGCFFRFFGVVFEERGGERAKRKGRGDEGKKLETYNLRKRTQRPQPPDQVPHAQVYRRTRRAQVRRGHVPDHHRGGSAPHLGEPEADEQGGERRARVRREDVEGQHGRSEERGAAGEEVAPSGAGQAWNGLRGGEREEEKEGIRRRCFFVVVFLDFAADLETPKRKKGKKRTVGEQPAPDAPENTPDRQDDS